MRRSDWINVLSLALVLRAICAFALMRSMPMVHDAESYVDFAAELLAGFPKAYYWPPGNSYLLGAIFAVTGKSILAARVVSILLGLLGVVMTVLVAQRVTSNERAQRITGYLAACYVPALLLAGQSYAQHLAALCLLALAYFFLRAVEEKKLLFFAAAGFFFAAGVLTRPSMASLAPFLLGAWILRARKELAGAAAFVVIAALLAAPVLLHNKKHGAGLAFSTNNERNLFLGNNPYTPSYKTSHLGQRDLSQLEPETRDYLAGYYDRPDAREAMQKAAVDYMVTHPGQTALRSVNRATSFWGFDYLGSRILEEHRGWGKKGLLPFLALEAGSYVLVMLLALAGLLAFKEESARLWRRWLVLFAFGYQLPYVIAFSGGTYHFPVIPLLMPFAGIALAKGPLPALRSRWVLAACAVFLLIQAQYAYYTLAMSG